jgi:hypothetical protein
MWRYAAVGWGASHPAAVHDTRCGVQQRNRAKASPRLPWEPLTLHSSLTGIYSGLSDPLPLPFVLVLLLRARSYVVRSISTFKYIGPCGSIPLLTSFALVLSCPWKSAAVQA